MSAALHILEPGTFTTVQDLGRPGWRSAGVARGGAVDPVSLRIANLLVGNDEGAAGLECALTGPTIRFRAACTVALCGACSKAIPDARPVRLRAGQDLTLGPLSLHAYAYLAIRGGIDVPQVLGSCSTDTRIGLGGHQGRRIAAGDVLAIGRQAPPRIGTLAGVNARSFLDRESPIRVLLASKSRGAAWLDSTYEISVRSDRMGLRLRGPRPDSHPPADGPSEIVVPGTIQLPPAGEMIILLADAQTLGGYPQIGQVISADLPRIAQRRPGQVVRFEAVDLVTAHRLAAQHERGLSMLRVGLGMRR